MSFEITFPALHAGGPLAQAELARHLGISRQRLHYNVKVFRKSSLVEIEAQGTVRLSSAGTALVLDTAGAPPSQTNAAG